MCNRRRRGRNCQSQAQSTFMYFLSLNKAGKHTRTASQTHTHTHRERLMQNAINQRTICIDRTSHDVAAAAAVAVTVKLESSSRANLDSTFHKQLPQMVAARVTLDVPLHEGHVMRNVTLRRNRISSSSFLCCSKGEEGGAGRGRGKGESSRGRVKIME